MGIEYDKEYTDYLVQLGLTAGSRSSYISRLRHLLDNGITVEPSVDEAIRIASLKFKDKGSLRTALNTYRRFLSSEVELLADLNEINTNEDSPTEKEYLRKARLGQGKYREDMINIWKRCSVSQIKNTAFLIASHIVPWRMATNTERLDPYNGLLLPPNFDKLFDLGCISFHDDGTIIISQNIEKTVFEQLGIGEGLKLNKVFENNIPYLRRHREFHRDILF